MQQLGSLGFAGESSNLNLTGLRDWNGEVPTNGSSVVYDSTTKKFKSGNSVPASAVGSDLSNPNTLIDDRMAIYSGTTGLLIEGSVLSVSATGDLAGAKTLALSGSTSGTLTLQPAAVTTPYTLTLPSAQGAATSILSNNGAGALSWLVTPSMRNVQYITASGTYTPTSGTTRALVYATGGGGSGAGGRPNVNNSVGGGGSSGGTRVGFFVIDDTKVGTVAIGVGATGTSGDGSGGNQTTFLFPSTGSPSGQITGPGGAGGTQKPIDTQDEYCATASSSIGTPTATSTNAVLLGGFPIFGQLGTTGFTINDDTGCAGNGAAGTWGGGALGPAVNNVSTNTNGTNALANSGGGGSGGIQTNNNGSSGVGGNGGSGVVIVFEY
jgi:hypothetical protein